MKRIYSPDFNEEMQRLGFDYLNSGGCTLYMRAMYDLSPFAVKVMKSYWGDNKFSSPWNERPDEGRSYEAGWRNTRMFSGERMFVLAYALHIENNHAGMVLLEPRNRRRDTYVIVIDDGVNDEHDLEYKTWFPWNADRFRVLFEQGKPIEFLSELDRIPLYSQGSSSMDTAQAFGLRGRGLWAYDFTFTLRGDRWVQIQHCGDGLNHLPDLFPLCHELRCPAHVAGHYMAALRTLYLETSTDVIQHKPSGRRAIWLGDGDSIPAPFVSIETAVWGDRAEEWGANEQHRMSGRII